MQNMNTRLKKLQSETFKLKNETSQSSIRDRIGSPDSFVLAAMSNGFENGTPAGYMNTQTNFSVSNHFHENNFALGMSSQNFNKPPS